MIISMSKIQFESKSQHDIPGCSTANHNIGSVLIPKYASDVMPWNSESLAIAWSISV